MSRFSLHLTPPGWLREIGAFAAFLRRYSKLRGYRWFVKFEGLKDVLVDLLYKQRGRYARPFLHFGTIALIFVVITLGPILLSQTDEDQRNGEGSSGVMAADAFGTGFDTFQSEDVRQYRGGEVITHVVQEGETLSSIAARYGLGVSTILWENGLSERSPLKPGQELRILPVDGIRHKVQRGETIYTIARKYGLEDEAEAQKIVNYPFNEFLNDETFELATGQYLVIPDGIKPDDPVARPSTRTVARLTPDAGTVTATGSFGSPASGKITQGYRFYHRGVDIANRGGGPVVAADSGTVRVSGWIDNSGYGNRIIIDHGNGYSTLYAHLSVVQVQVGQRVNRGDLIGQMGSTGRSTGTHLHFEIRQGGVLVDPTGFLP